MERKAALKEKAAEESKTAMKLALIGLNYMGDIINAFDLCEREDEEALTPIFRAVRSAIGITSEEEVALLNSSGLFPREYTEPGMLRVIRADAAEFRSDIAMLIDFIPSGWEMPLGWGVLVAQMKEKYAVDGPHSCAEGRK